MNHEELIQYCHQLIEAYRNGSLGNTTMPEDSHPNFNNKESKLVYFTFPMALNYQRDSYTLWKSALQTYTDPETREVFNVNKSAKNDINTLQNKLLKHHLALQPNKHIATWQKLAQTFFTNWGSIEEFFNSTNNDYLIIRDTIQNKKKKDFPYLSGPKIFNYWCFIISTYGGIELKNKELIEIAPDTHITKCSVLLGVITQDEADTLSRDQISSRWREILSDSGITPIEMHSPLWFWSKNNFTFKLK